MSDLDTGATVSQTLKGCPTHGMASTHVVEVSTVTMTFDMEGVRDTTILMSGGHEVAFDIEDRFLACSVDDCEWEADLHPDYGVDVRLVEPSR